MVVYVGVTGYVQEVQSDSEADVPKAFIIDEKIAEVTDAKGNTESNPDKPCQSVSSSKLIRTPLGAVATETLVPLKAEALEAYLRPGQKEPIASPKL